MRIRLHDGLVDRIWKTADHNTWHILFHRQCELLENKACSLFWEGLEILNHKEIPVRNKISKELLDKIGWVLAAAENRYLSDEQWFNHLAKKEFPVTDFFRQPHEVDFTPEPDLFHDFFGHMPQIVHPRISDLAHKFGLAFQTAKNKDDVARLWWYTLEFGLIKENGKIKILGAGLFSSKEELVHSMNEDLWLPFSFDLIKRTPKAVATVHPQYFVLDSLDELEETLQDLLDKEKRI